MNAKFKKRMIPKTKPFRLVAGILLVIGGIFGFLPILGFWMIPLGLFILSVDFKSIRKKRRQIEIYLGRKFFRKNGANNGL